MNPALNHDEAFAELDAVAFDLLDESRRDAVLAHVDQCDICRPELDAIRATAANLAFAAPVAVNDSATRAPIRERLVTRAAAGKQVFKPTATPLVFPTQLPGSFNAGKAWRGAEWLALAASILLVASLGVIGFGYRERLAMLDSARSDAARAERAGRIADSLGVVVAGRDSLLSGLTGRSVTVMTLTSSAAKEPFARMFWDRATNRWTLVAQNMPVLAPGQTYQLWLVTPRGKISAGTFDTENGKGVVSATYELGQTRLDAIAVTIEPRGGVPQPTGEVIIAANTR